MLFNLALNVSSSSLSLESVYRSVRHCTSSCVGPVVALSWWHAYLMQQYHIQGQKVFVLSCYLKGCHLSLHCLHLLYLSGGPSSHVAAGCRGENHICHRYH